MRLTLAGAVVVAGLCLGAEVDAQTYIIAGDGWEAFPGVEYQGGDARFPEKVRGVLVLTDSTLAFHPCRVKTQGGCAIEKGKLAWKDPAHFVVDLRQIQSIETSTQVRGASAGMKLLVGGLANDRSVEFMSFAHETASSAEAPVFKTYPTQAGALDAKVRFRMKKLGRELAP